MAFGPEKRYGKALFELATEEKQTTALVKEADTLISILQDETNELVALINNSMLSSHKKSDVFVDILKKSKASDTMRKFVGLMVKNGRGEVLLGALTWFKDFYLAEEKVVKAKVTTAFPLATSQKAEIEKFVKKQVKGSKKIELEEKVNEELIGGFKVLIGSQEFDASLSGSLNKIKTSLRN